MTDRPHILVTRRLPEDVLARADASYQATFNEADEGYDTDELVRLAQGMDGLLVTITNRMDAETIANLPDSIRVIATFSVGYEHIDLTAAEARNIVVTNTPGVLTNATAEIAMLLMLGAARRAREGAEMIRDDTWTGWTPTQLMGIEVTGKRLGLVGMGEIGRAVAKRARAFDMDIHYHNRTRLDSELERGAQFHDTLESLLEQSDFLSLHCPLTPQTHHLMTRERIDLLPDNPVIINTARGPVIDDEVLIEALKSGRVAAAGLDVFEGEPNLHEEYRNLSNAYLLPHLGSATVETRNAMGFTALDNLDAFFAGKEPPNRIV